MINFFKKHWEVLSYLVFGVLCTLLNIVLYALFNKLFGYTAANSWGNVLDNIICILFAYCTNRAFVFRSKTQGKVVPAPTAKRRRSPNPTRRKATARPKFRAGG